MATYATEPELAAYLQDNPDVTAPVGEAAERLLEHGQRDVDRVLGRYPKDGTTGLKIDVSTLTAGQRAALSRATCAAVEFRLMLDAEDLTGATDVLPPGVTSLRVAGRVAPRIEEELAGYGLVRDRLTGVPEPTGA